MSSIKETPIDWETWQAEIPATLLFVKKNDQVLLIEKLRGIGKGKVNGPGGKIDPGETPLQAAVREVQEELLITPEDPVKVGELCFAMSDIPDIHCHVFIATKYEGTPSATPEAIPMWTRISEIPYERMWEDDRHWLGHALTGRTFHARFVFEGEQIRWKHIEFDVPVH